MRRRWATVEASNDDILGHFLAESHTVPPSALAGFAAQHAANFGSRETVVYLVSYEQRHLQPLPGEGVPEREPLDIAGTLAGRVYRTSLDSADRSGGRLWVPLLDGTTRLGVLELNFGEDSGTGGEPGIDEPRQVLARRFAAALSELLVSRNMYGDELVRVRRRQPMSLAAEMQWGLLPPQMFTDGRITVAGALEPAYTIAGDSFDYAYNGDVLHFAIIDAMGHGFEAMLLATVAIGVYRHSRRAGRDLPGIHAAMDEVVSARFGPDRFVTAQLGELDAGSGVLRWVNAGHPAPLLVRGGRVVGALECTPTFPIGFGGAISEIAEERLEPLDTLLFYTDGVVEARSPDGEFFGDERLGDLLGRAVTAGLPAGETVRRLSHAILDHQAGDLHDDATTVLVEWNGRPDSGASAPFPRT